MSSGHAGACKECGKDLKQFRTPGEEFICSSCSDDGGEGGASGEA